MRRSVHPEGWTLNRVSGQSREDVLNFIRCWNVVFDGVALQVDVKYAAQFGWMSIYVDGRQSARGRREWQSVIGGANLSCDVDGHRIDARVTQPFGRQEYSFALRVDGVLQPGSDLLPEPRAVTRRTVKAIGWLVLVVFVATITAQIGGRLSQL